MKRLFFDIETSPNVVMTWRCGRKEFVSYENILIERAIICIAWKLEGVAGVESLRWDKEHNDKNMLRRFIRVANEADELVAHNGDRFDLPWIRSRCVFHRIPMFPEYRTVDTLKVSQKGFYFNSDRLDYLGKFMGFGGKAETARDLWRRVVVQKCPKALQEMVTYCERDVELLEKVWRTLSFYSPATTHAGALAGHDKWTCPHCGSTHVKAGKMNVTATGYRKRQMQCNKCGHYYTICDSAHRQYQEYRETKTTKKQ